MGGVIESLSTCSGLQLSLCFSLVSPSQDCLSRWAQQLGQTKRGIVHLRANKMEVVRYHGLDLPELEALAHLVSLQNLVDLASEQCKAAWIAMFSVEVVLVPTHDHPAQTQIVTA